MFWDTALWWLSVLIPAVARIIWHNNFRASLLLVSSDSVTGEESLSSNQSTTINTSCYGRLQYKVDVFLLYYSVIAIKNMHYDVVTL